MARRVGMTDAFTQGTGTSIEERSVRDVQMQEKSLNRHERWNENVKLGPFCASHSKFISLSKGWSRMTALDHFFVFRLRRYYRRKPWRKLESLSVSSLIWHMCCDLIKEFAEKYTSMMSQTCKDSKVARSWFVNETIFDNLHY